MGFVVARVIFSLPHLRSVPKPGCAARHRPGIYAAVAHPLIPAGSARDNRELGFWGAESEAERATAGFAPTTPIIGRRQVAAERAAAALAAAAGGS